MNKKVATYKIILIGMPGSGKSYWGKILNKKFKLPFYDLDSIIEVMDDRTIVEIFEQEGEDYFRKVETKMLHLFEEKKQFILSTGGGAPCYGNNLQWMNNNGITIWLDEPVEVLCNRIESDAGSRPLFKNLQGESLKNKVIQLLEERKPFYEQAQHKLSGNHISEPNFVQILNQYV